MESETGTESETGADNETGADSESEAAARQGNAPGQYPGQYSGPPEVRNCSAWPRTGWARARLLTIRVSKYRFVTRWGL